MFQVSKKSGNGNHGNSSIGKINDVVVFTRHHVTFSKLSNLMQVKWTTGICRATIHRQGFTSNYKRHIDREQAGII